VYAPAIRIFAAFVIKEIGGKLVGAPHQLMLARFIVT
jgi:hypothetical protein